MRLFELYPFTPDSGIVLYNLTDKLPDSVSGKVTIFIIQPFGSPHDVEGEASPVLRATINFAHMMPPSISKFAESALIATPARLGEPNLSRIGNTPLLRLDRILREFPQVQLLGKAEWYNPGGSVKDRAAYSIVSEARHSGKLTPGKTLLDSTSGNTGIAYAMIGAAEAFPVTLCMPENVSVERKRILFAYGANIVYTPAADGSDGAMQRARELHARDPEKYFYADQYSNDANWRAHYEGTAEEIWQQSEGRITHFVAMLGTSGTFVGTARRLKELKPGIRCISLQPDSPFHGIEGAKHMASAMVPRIYDRSLADEDLAIATEEAYALTIRASHEEGVLVGISAGAALAGCRQVAARIPPEEEAVMVTILPDSGDKYLSERFWTES